MDFISAYLIVISVAVVAMVSPGPDFLIAMRNALVSGARRGSPRPSALAVLFSFMSLIVFWGLRL